MGHYCDQRPPAFGKQTDRQKYICQYVTFMETAFNSSDQSLLKHDIVIIDRN